MKQILAEQLKCHSTSLAIWPRATMIPVFGGTTALEAHNAARLKAKIFVRTIVVSDETEIIPTSSASYNEVRHARPGTDLPMGLLIFDTGKVACISAGKDMFGFIIESEDLYRSMRFFFEALWMQTELR